MIYRGLYLADGPSDLPLARHVERLCLRHQLQMDIVPVPAERLPAGTGRKVEARIRAVVASDASFDCVFVHRDAEAQESSRRHREVREGAHRGGFEGPVVAVVPIRMTEAWLLLDEAAIRRVAGRPNGTQPLNLPQVAEIERLADPKRRLQDTLIFAAELRGRRLHTFKRRFGEHRRQLLDQIDADGPVRQLAAWQTLERDIAALAVRRSTP